MNYHDIITLEPGKRSDKPCIRGMRITVYDILEYLAGGMTETEILEDFKALRAPSLAIFYGLLLAATSTILVITNSVKSL
ncbi:DUF433 domain-containing protein [Nostoc sp.]|uniref:DUF433 domain-containing protein n=1 Tax=Nostoc sp. TaxID=1180 RepID=UPI002FF82467